VQLSLAGSQAQLLTWHEVVQDFLDVSQVSLYKSNKINLTFFIRGAENTLYHLNRWEITQKSFS
jgi:hypothetical protein